MPTSKPERYLLMSQKIVRTNLLPKDTSFFLLWVFRFTRCSDSAIKLFTSCSIRTWSYWTSKTRSKRVFALLTRAVSDGKTPKSKTRTCQFVHVSDSNRPIVGKLKGKKGLCNKSHLRKPVIYTGIHFFCKKP